MMTKEQRNLKAIKKNKQREKTGTINHLLFEAFKHKKLIWRQMKSKCMMKL